MSSWKRTFVKLFQFVYVISILGILGIAFSKPLHNLVPGRMFFYTLFWVVLLCALWYLCVYAERKVPKLERWMKFILPTALIVYAIALYIVSCLIRSEPVTDYQNVYEAALQFARGQEVSNWDYFARWYNNVGSMLVLSALFALGGWLPASADVYYFVLLINVIQVMGVVACLSYLAGELAVRHKVAARTMMLLLCFLWIPIWSNSSIFYSDQLSFGAGVFGLTLLVRGWKSRRWYLYLAGAGMTLAIGVILKATVGTILVALGIMGFLFSKYWEKKGRILVVLLSFALVMGSYSLYCKTLPYQKDAYRLKMPVEYWLAIGIGGNGTYADNEEFAIRCETAKNYDVRKELSREYIVEHLDNLVDPYHITEKVRQNFGFGDLGSAGYFLYKESPNIVWNWVSQEGTYFWKFGCLSTSLFFAVLFLIGVGGCVRLLRNREYQKEDFLQLSVELAFWGMCLFLMLWEAQDKQLYNHSGWILLSLVGSLNSCT